MALLHADVYAKRIACRIVSVKGAHDRKISTARATSSELESRRTQDECVMPRYVEAPLSEVVVHLHCKHGEVLVDVEVYGVRGVERRIVVDDVALGLRKPEVGRDVRAMDERREVKRRTASSCARRQPLDGGRSRLLENPGGLQFTVREYMRRR